MASNKRIGFEVLSTNMMTVVEFHIKKKKKASKDFFIQTRLLIEGCQKNPTFSFLVFWSQFKGIKIEFYILDSRFHIIILNKENNFSRLQNWENAKKLSFLMGSVLCKENVDHCQIQRLSQKQKCIGLKILI